MIRTGGTPIEYHRTPDDSREAALSVLPGPPGGALPGRMLGNFIEHFTFSIYGGLWAQQLANPTFHRDANLRPEQTAELLRAGALMTEYYLSGKDPNALPPNWSPWGDYSGFGVLSLDDATAQKIPFPWSPVGEPGRVSASNGRIGGALRLRPAGAGHEPVDLEHGPAGVRQGVFLPVDRVRTFHGDLWARIFTGQPAAQGTIEVGIRRRLAQPGRMEGERLAFAALPIHGGDWEKIPYRLELAEGAVDPSEPVDVYLRWLPGSVLAIDLPAEDLLVDRFFLYPDDAVGIFDPEVIRLARDWPVPLLRWPGGNFASGYHWRDGVGPEDRRPTRKNEAWSGLEYNFIGTQEFIQFCRLIGAEPQITVNLGSGSPQEAAEWVEYCNGDESTPMGRLRASHGSPDPFNVRLWEVGNEIYGSWQVGNIGAEENAERFHEFAAAMRAVDPSIELIATGSAFDFVQPGPSFDHTQADRRWNRALLERAAEQIDYISLHSLPVNDLFLEQASGLEVHQAVMAQITTWERRFLPELLALADEIQAATVKDGEGKKPIGLAITEWAILGKINQGPWADTYDEAIYAGLFLNMMARNARRIPIANTTGLLHGGCIRKVAGTIFYDAQYPVIQQYARLIGAQPLPLRLEAPGHDVPQGADLGAPERDVPEVDAVLAWKAGPAEEGGGLYAALVNQSLEEAIRVNLSLPEYPVSPEGEWTCISHTDILAKATPANGQPYSVKKDRVAARGGCVAFEIPACSVNMVWFKGE